MISTDFARPSELSWHVHAVTIMASNETAWKRLFCVIWITNELKTGPESLAIEQIDVSLPLVAKSSW